jgi:hypothetical protein
MAAKAERLLAAVAVSLVSPEEDSWHRIAA